MAAVAAHVRATLVSLDYSAALRALLIALLLDKSECLFIFLRWTCTITLVLKSATRLACRTTTTPTKSMITSLLVDRRDKLAALPVAAVIALVGRRIQLSQFLCKDLGFVLW
jgi:hypothetical protein